MIRVGRRIYNRDGSFTDPSYPNFQPIVCLTASTPYGELGPYVMTDEQGRIFENIYQFSKVYQRVPRVRQPHNRYNPTINWEHPSELHVNATGQLTDEYWAWREKGMNHPYPVRYPVGFHNMSKCLYSVLETEDSFVELDYIQARKQIYLPLYIRLVKQRPKFTKLLNMLRAGTNLLIIEVDGPHSESLPYYKEKYGVGDDFIDRDTILISRGAGRFGESGALPDISEQNLDIMLNDPKHPFGHGYCLAMALKTA